MKPGSFDAVTAREIVGDADARALEAKARADADARAYDAPAVGGETYWDSVQRQMRFIVYDSQYVKRLERIERMRGKAKVAS
jgi:hypothetical protein